MAATNFCQSYGEPHTELSPRTLRWFRRKGIHVVHVSRDDEHVVALDFNGYECFSSVDSGLIKKLILDKPAAIEGPTDSETQIPELGGSVLQALKESNRATGRKRSGFPEAHTSILNDGQLSLLKHTYKNYRLELTTPTLLWRNMSGLRKKKLRRGKLYNWKTATYRKIWDNEDVHGLGSVESEFPAIVFNDTLTYEAALLCEPTVSSLNNDEINFRISFDEYDDEDCTVIFYKNSFSYKIISVNDLKTDLKNDNDKVNMPLLPSPEPTVSYFDDLDYFKDFDKEFPAIVYNDALTSKLDFLTEHTVSPQHIDEFNLKDKTSLSECDEEEQNVLYFNDVFPFNVIYPNDSKSDKDNDDDKVDIEHSSGDLSVKPLPDVINTDVGAYAHGSNKLLETSINTAYPGVWIWRIDFLYSFRVFPKIFVMCRLVIILMLNLDLLTLCLVEIFRSRLLRLIFFPRSSPVNWILLIQFYRELMMTIFDEEEGEIDIDIFQIEDEILREKLLNVNLLIDKIEALNLTPSIPFVLEYPSSSPIAVVDSDFLIEGVDTFLVPEDSIPPGIESDFDSEGDILFSNDLLNDDPILEYERFTYDIEPDAPVINGCYVNQHT
ncbi:hypothetical protein Tco_0746853 [Tanacetum coccineum]